jgi:hypothetical protein
MQFFLSFSEEKKLNSTWEINIYFIANQHIKTYAKHCTLQIYKKWTKVGYGKRKWGMLVNRESGKIWVDAQVGKLGRATKRPVEPRG